MDKKLKDVYGNEIKENSAVIYKKGSDGLRLGIVRSVNKRTIYHQSINQRHRYVPGWREEVIEISVEEVMTGRWSYLKSTNSLIVLK